MRIPVKLTTYRALRIGRTRNSKSGAHDRYQTLVTEKLGSGGEFLALSRPTRRVRCRLGLHLTERGPIPLANLEAQPRGATSIMYIRTCMFTFLSLCVRTGHQYATRLFGRPRATFQHTRP